MWAGSSGSMVRSERPITASDHIFHVAMSTATRQLSHPYPLGSRVTTRAGADVDLDARQLVAAVGALELHAPCGCVVVRATASHRIGREGVDVWLTVDLPH